MNDHAESNSVIPDGSPKIRRLNKVPVFAFVGLVVVVGVVIIYGLATRGMSGGSAGIKTERGQPASNFADQLKAGVPDAVIDPPQKPAPPPQQDRAQAQLLTPPSANPFQPTPQQSQQTGVQPPRETDKEWREQLARRNEEQRLQLKQQLLMKRLQSADAALDSPIAVNLKDVASQGQAPNTMAPAGQGGGSSTMQLGAHPSGADLYSAALQAVKAGQGNADPNGQSNKIEFLNKDLSDAGYLPKQVVAQQSPYELKRGSAIPSTLITGINSDLPGRITAQVRQNVYDSATGHYLLIPQGTKLFGRYDSKVSFGQSRVLVAWTDIIFPNGSTLQIGGMAGVDVEGYGGFKDKVNNHYLKTFGSAILLSIIGTGIDMSVPQSSTLATQDTASDAARRNFANVFGRVSEKTIDKNLSVQPTLEIRPGYNFNILVDQDIVFPGSYQ